MCAANADGSGHGGKRNTTGAVGEIEVHFNPTPFLRAPQVVVTPNVTGIHLNYAMSVYKVSAQGFSVGTVDMVNNPVNVGFDFIAIQP
jgi:hypothetical protein